MKGKWVVSRQAPQGGGGQKGGILLLVKLAELLGGRLLIPPALNVTSLKGRVCGTFAQVRDSLSVPFPRSLQDIKLMIRSVLGPLLPNLL